MLVIHNIGALKDEWDRLGNTFLTGWDINDVSVGIKKYRIDLVKLRERREAYVDIYRERIAMVKDELLYSVDFNGKIKGLYGTKDLTKDMIIKCIYEYIIDLDND